MGSAIEQTSHEKARAYRERYETVIAADTYHCIGSFVFLWGQKQERTPTWYGMFLESGEKKESVDVMQFLWTGKWPDNRSPHLLSFTLNGKTSYDNIYLSPGTDMLARADATDLDHDSLQYHWEIIPEVPDALKSDGGDFEPVRKPYTAAIPKITASASLHRRKPAPTDCFVCFRRENSAATANIPFFDK